MKRRLTAMLLWLFVVVLLAQPTMAATTMVEIDVTGIESNHNYANNITQTWTLSCPGADSITMTFDSLTALETNYDFLYVYDANGKEIGKYSGTSLAGQTITVEGDVIELKLTSDGSVNRWGFRVTEAYGTISYDSNATEIDVTGIESNHNYANNITQTWTLSCPGADSITMTFDAQTKLESNYDFLFIYNASDTEVGKYSGTSLAGQTITVEGDFVTLKLTSDYSNVYWGFKVTEAYGTFTGSGSGDSSDPGDSSDGSFSGGQGTESAPYLIETKAQLNNVRNDLDAHYKMMADIIFTDADFASGGAFYNDGTGWTPIGDTGDKFTGSFDGNGHTITGLKISLAEPAEGAGLFGYTDGAVIQRLGMVDGEISNSGNTYWKLAYAGSIVGRADDSQISECYNTGAVSASTDAGGIIGFGGGFTEISNCYNTGTVLVTETDGTAGGICGSADLYCRLKTCYNTGAVGARTYAGGIAGEAGTAFYITDCYYRDTASIGIASGTSDPSVKCTVSQMHQQATFESFDFSGVWTMAGNPDYDCPELRSVNHVGEEDAFSNNSSFAGGLGTESAPYLIETTGQLNLVRNYLSSHFKLANNLTFTDADFASGGAFYNSGKGWTAIGTAGSPFTGSFDGDGHTITGLYQKFSASAAYGGLFGIIQNATIKNLGMVDASIVATTSSYGNYAYAGSVVGSASGSIIAGCYNTGSVKATVSASQTTVYAGGIVGYTTDCTILNCYNRGTVISGASSSSGIDFTVCGGGIAGYIAGGTTVTNCYHAGTVTGSPGAIFSSSYVGGIVGQTYSSSVGCAYSAGTLHAYKGNSGSAYKGGIFGYKDSSSTDTYCYYMDSCTAGVGKGTDTAVKCTEAQMEQQSTFEGFDFRSCWTMGDGASYDMPTLRERKLMSHEIPLHPVCGAVCSHTPAHETMEATMWNGEEIVSGDYYLGSDLDLSEMWVITDDIRLCLNGYTITFAEQTGLIVREGASLELCDCKGTGGIVRGPRVSNGDGGILNNYGSLTIYGGTYCPDGEGVCLYNTGTLIFYGGIFGIPLDNSGTTVIHDAVFDLPEPDYTPYSSAMGNAKGASLTIYDGTFQSHGSVLYNKGSAVIRGGTFRGVGTDGLNYYECIDNAGMLYLYDGDISSTYHDGIGNDIAYEYSSSGNTQCTGTLYVYGGTISAPAENRAAISSRTQVTVRGGTISGYIGIDNGSIWAGSSKDGGVCSIYGGTISGTRCGIRNSGNTSTQYSNGVVSGYLFSRGILKIYENPSISSILLEYPKALELQYVGSDIIDLEIDFDDIKVGDILWQYAVSALPKVHLVNEGYVLQNSYDGITIASNACGANGDNLRWSLSPDGVLTIFGTGDMKNFGFSNEQPWYYSRTQIHVKKVVLEEGVTSVGSAAFGEMTHLTEVELPDSLTQMGNWVFEYSNYQGALELPSGLQTIGRNIFNGCSAAPAQITYDGCRHQWESVSVDVQTPSWAPTVLPNMNSDDGDDTTELRCSVCGGIDIAGINSIEVATLPAKLEYLEGKALDVTGGKITVYYSDSTSEEINLTADMVSGYDSLTIGTQTLTVTYKRMTATFAVTVHAKSLISVTVNTLPAKLTYIRGEEELDLTGGMLTLGYDNDTTETVALTAEMVSSIDHSQAGTQTIAVLYENLFDFFDISLIDRTAIEITVLPDQLTYLEGIPFDLSGSELTVSFSDGSTTTMALEHSMLSYDPAAIGSVGVTVSYKGFTDTFEVTVIAKSATSIAVTAPTKTSYLEGKEMLDVAGGKVTVCYDNGTEEEIDLTAEMISGFDNTTVGRQTLTVSYGGFTDTFVVTVEAKTLVSIGVAVLPQPLVFIEGTALEVAGGKITLYYDNDTQDEIDLTIDMVSGFDNTIIGAQTLTVSYNGKTTAYDVEIVARSVESIAVTTLPARTAYIEGKIPLDVTGGKVTLYYDNGTEEELDLMAEMVQGFDNTIVGEQTLTVTYEGFETTYNITVHARVIERVSLTAPGNLIYLQGSALDLTGGYLTVVYVSDDNYTEEIPLDSSMISGYDPERVGVQVVKVTYEGQSATFAVRVTAKSATSIAVTAPTKTSYLEGEEMLDVAGGKVTVCYDNGTEEEMDLTAEMISGFDNTTVGRQTLTVTYGGFTDTFEIEIVASQVSMKIRSVSDDCVQVYCKNNQAGICFAAVYDTDGKMLSVGHSSVVADAGEMSITLPQFDIDAMHEVKVFLVDVQYIPLCDCAVI